MRKNRPPDEEILAAVRENALALVRALDRASKDGTLDLMVRVVADEEATLAFCQFMEALAEISGTQEAFRAAASEIPKD